MRRQHGWSLSPRKLRICAAGLALSLIPYAAFCERMNRCEGEDRYRLHRKARTLTDAWAALPDRRLQDGGSVLFLLDQKKIPIVPDDLLDPWRRPFVLCGCGGSLCICSLGADGKPSGVGLDKDFILTDESTWPAAFADECDA